MVIGHDLNPDFNVACSNQNRTYREWSKTAVALFHPTMEAARVICKLPEVEVLLYRRIGRDSAGQPVQVCNSKP